MKKILIIDDQKDNLITIKAVININIPNCDVLTALSGKEGIEIAKKQQPDTILLDILMPEMDGYETCMRLTKDELTRHIPIIIMTASKADAKVRAKALNMGADAFLTKPIDATELIAQINVMFRIKSAEDKLRIERDNLNELVNQRTKEIKHQAGILNNVFDPIITLDMELKITSWNVGAEKLYGWKADEVIGKEFKDILSPEYINETREEVINTLNSTGRYIGEVKHYTKSGECLIIKGSVTLVKDANGNPIEITSVGYDITEQKRTQKELIESETKYKLMFKNMLNAFAYHKIVTDENGNAIDYIILEANNGFEELTGLKTKDAIGKPITQLIKGIENDPADWISTYGEIALNGKELHFESFSEPLNKWYSIYAYSPQEGYFVTIFEEITEKKESEILIKESEQKFRLLADNTNDWEYWIDENGNYVYLSAACEKITGYQIEEFKNEPDLLFKLVHPEYLEFVQNHYKKGHIHKSGSSFDFKITDRNGDTRWIEHSCTQVLDKNGNYRGRRGNNRDVTDKKKNEITLRLSEERRRTILRTAIDGYWVTDMKGDFLEVNESYCRMSGYSINELLKMNISDLEALQTKQEILSVIQQIEKTGETRFESKHTKKDGNLFDVEVSVQYQPYDGGQCVCFLKNIDEQKRLEKEKLLNEKRQDALLELNQMNDSSLESIYGYTLEEAVDLTESSFGFLGFVNDDYSKVTIYNWSGEAMEQCAVKDFSVEFEVEKAGIWGEVVRTGKPLLINDFTLPNPLKKGIPKGHVKLENYLSIPVYANKKIVAVVAVANKENDYIESDIKQLTLLLDGMWKFTQQYNAQNDLKKALDKANESDRLKSAFLATMSHELRTPLNAVIGFSDIINSDMEMKEVLNSAQIINKSGEHLLSIVENLFEITLIESGQTKINKSKENIASLLNDIYEIINIEKNSLGKHHLVLELIKTDSCDKMTFHTDGSKLKQILINLLKNAVKFTSEGYVKFGYECEMIMDESCLKFYVEDTGIGIAKDKQNIIFDAFRQADESNTKRFGGTGIGLSIAKKLTELLGGKIWVESEEEKGSKFCFTLPLPKHKSDGCNERIGAIITKNLNFKAILIAEDDESSYEYLNTILKNATEKIMWAENGEQAVKICKENPAIDLVLMDVNMPIMNGYEATKAIKKFRPNLPIIAQTAYAISGDMEKALENGCDDYIAKPIKKGTVIHVTSKVYETIAVMKTLISHN